MKLNFFKKLDCFSPYITLFFDDSPKHTSSCSVLISLFYYSVVMSIILFNLIQIFLHKNFISKFTKGYIEKDEKLEINEEIFNHTILLHGENQFDPKAVTVIGVEIDPNQPLINPIEDIYNHWVYSNCNKDVGLLCIKEYYNKDEKKLISRDNLNFTFPNLIYKKENSISYAILIKSCQNSTKNNGSCYAKEKIEEIKSKYSSIKISFNDHYIDMKSYEHPIANHNNFFEIYITETEIKTAVIHIAPLYFKSYSGFLKEKKKEIKSFSLKKIILDVNNNNNIIGSQNSNEVFGMYSFLLNNKVNIYEREYENLLHALINIVTLSEISFYIFWVFNYFVHKYTVYKDFGLLYENSCSRIARISNSISLGQESSKQKGNFLPRKQTRTNVKVDISRLSFFSQNQYSMKSFVFHYFKCKSSKVIENIKLLRTQALGEDKIINLHLLFKNIDAYAGYGESFFSKSKLIFSSFLKDSKKNSSMKFDLNNSTEALKKQNFIKETDIKKENL